MEETVRQLIAELDEAFVYIGTRLKTLSETGGNLTALKTTEKTSLVGAINELKTTLAGIQTTGSGITPQEVEQKINEALKAFENKLYGGELTEDLNQLKEFAEQINSNKTTGNQVLAKLVEITTDLNAIKTVLKTDFIAIVKRAEGVDG